MSSTKIPCSASNQSSANPPPSFADVVRETVKDTLYDVKVKSQLILSTVKEEDGMGKDAEYMTVLCNKLNHKTQVKHITRIGKKTANSHRLMKVTFETEFDARSFKARYEEMKLEEGIPKLRIRPCKTRAEQAVYNKLKTVASKLTDEAKKQNEPYSFSVRDSG